MTTTLEETRPGIGKVVPSLLATIFVLAVAGIWMFVALQRTTNLLGIGGGLLLVALAAGLALFLIIEFGLLRLVSLTQAGAIMRVTYYEALLQPFTLILLVVGVACVVIFAFVPFFTLNEDAKMYRDVGVSFALLFTLPVMIFSASKVIDEEIENRTMLTLMSKPVTRTQVVLGKYAGVLLVCLVNMAIIGGVVAVCAYVRYRDDMRLDYVVSKSATEWAALDTQNVRAIMALAPALILEFLQIAALAAVAVAISTRWGLAFNITAISLLYVFANLTQFVDTLHLPQPWQGMLVSVSSVLPHLSAFDLNQRLIYGQFVTAGDVSQLAIGDMASHKAAAELPTWTQIWLYVGKATVYAVLYIGAALSAGVALFRTRELS